MGGKGIGEFARPGVVGAGAWGTALANLLCEKAPEVSLWVHEDELARAMGEVRENHLYLPGVKLSSGVVPTPDLKEAVTGRDLLVVVTPSHVLRQVVREAASHYPPDCPVVVATKGLEGDTLKRMSQVIEEVMPQVAGRVAVLSGPSFAKEVCLKVPTAVTIASGNEGLGARLQAFFSNSYFRVYTSSDVIGVEIGGAVKNVIAIAVGACVGMGLGCNSQAAVITRGVTEMSRMGVALGANPLTLAGLSGLGDLVLTATGELSRNRAFGIRLGKGDRPEEILGEMKTVAEGVRTAKAVHALAHKLKIEMPISHQVYRMLYEGLPATEAVSALMGRELKGELEF